MIGSLCTGYAGLELAVTAVTGQPTAWMCEYDKHPSKILSERFPDVPNLHNVTEVDWASVEPVEILTAGYPCQPFSHAGKRKGSTDDRHLWPHIADAIGALRPRLVVLENVAGHLSLGFGDVLGDLAAMGYDAKWGVVRASDAGAPHNRARVFIVATDTENIGHERGGQPRRRGVGPTNHGETTTDASSQRHGRGQDGGAVGRVDSQDAATPQQRQRAWPLTSNRSDATWGIYTPAIEGWERILGRPAPEPTEPGRNGPRLAPRFVEWMMGLPDGWVTAVDIPRSAQLKALGNGVVPQQASLALNMLDINHNEETVNTQ
jgi:DNA (cytosine-5)-methyltransferase 1